MGRPKLYANMITPENPHPCCICGSITPPFERWCNTCYSAYQNERRALARHGLKMTKGFSQRRRQALLELDNPGNGK